MLEELINYLSQSNSDEIVTTLEFEEKYKSKIHNFMKSKILGETVISDEIISNPVETLYFKDLGLLKFKYV